MTLNNHLWKLRYRSHSDDLVQAFYIPALSESIRYDRGAGFFSSSALAIASKGVGRLISNQGKMRLLVSHHLSEADTQALKEGYALREHLQNQLQQELLRLEDDTLKDRLALLSWMISHQCLEVKVAVMTRANGQYDLGSLYHEKIGIFTDAEGNQIAFEGSVNESAKAWLQNQESFSLFLSWEGRDQLRIQEIQSEFELAWSGQAPRIEILDFTQALQDKLIQFRLPQDSHDWDLPEPQNTIKIASKPVPATIQPIQTLTSAEEQALFKRIDEAPQQGLPGKKLTFTTSTISPLPHQQRVFLKASEQFPKRFLFAEEVGLGKTIEAGSLIRYLLMSKQVKRVLVLVPKSVLRQWQHEIYEKLNLPFWLYNGKSFESPLGQEKSVLAGNPWDSVDLILASSHLVKRRDRRDQLLQSSSWDLVVVDEAHHARRKNPSRKNASYEPNLLLRLLENLSKQTKCLYLLTATPMQVEMIEAWDLLRLLNIRGTWATDSQAFLAYYQQLQEGLNAQNLKFLVSMCRSADLDEFELDTEVRQKLGREYSPNAVKKLERYIRKEKMADLINLLSESFYKPCLNAILHEATPLKKRMFRNTREQLREYRRQGILKEKIAERRPVDRFIDFSQLEFDIYSEIDDYIKNFFTQPEGQSEQALGFVSSIYKRRATSSLKALELSLKRRLEKLKGFHTAFVDDDDLDEDLEEEMEEETTENLPPQKVELEKEKINDLLYLIKQVHEDTKFEVFVQHLKSTLGHGHYQAIVFTQYTDTMDYIKAKISYQFGSELACYSGRGGEQFDGYSWVTVSKDVIKQRFKEQKIQILLCTDAASEGLNLQTAGLLYNYDMPWNPMRVEQRIGRIDRIGQAKDVIEIVNFYYRESVEAKIYEVLRSRIDIFSTVVGNLQPILATLAQRITHLSLEHLDIDTLIEGLDQDIQNAQKNIDFTQFSDTEITYALNEVEPEISPDEIENAFLNSQSLIQLGYRFQKSDSEIPGTYLLMLPDLSQKLISFQPDVFDENPTQIEYLSYLNPLFESMMQEVRKVE